MRSDYSTNSIVIPVVLVLLYASLALTVTSCGGEGAPGNERYELSWDNATREYYVNQPVTCTEDCPVVIDMHGFLGSPLQQQENTGLFDLSESEGFIGVWPGGLNASWNAGDGGPGEAGCCGPSQINVIDDVGFILAMIEEITENYPVDADRIYASGSSAGCSLAQRLGTEAGDVIAAVACTSHFLLSLPVSEILNSTSVTVLHGLNDNIAPYAENGNPVFRFPGAQKNFQLWGELNNCEAEPIQIPLTANSFYEQYSGCDDDVSVSLYSINGGHFLFSEVDGLDMSQILWDNMKDHSRR